MRIERSTVNSPTALTTSPFHSLLFINDDQATLDEKNHLPLHQPPADQIPPGPVERASQANAVELRIFFVVFSIFLLASSYFIIKAIVRTWKRRSTDYILTWSNAHNKQSVCKCMLQHSPFTSKNETEPRLSTTVDKAAQDEEEDEAGVHTGPPTTSSGVGTVDSSDASADTASTNPLLEILSASSNTPPPEQPSPTTGLENVSEVALINPSLVIECPSLDVRIFRHQRRHHNHRRRVNAEICDAQFGKRNSNSSPPSPIFPRRRSETDDATRNACSSTHNHELGHAFVSRQQHRKKRGVSLDAADKRARSATVYICEIAPKIEAPTVTPFTSSNESSPLDHNANDYDWLRPCMTWVTDDDETGSLSIPLSVATAPPDYFDTATNESERQAFCSRYKPRRSICSTATEPGTP